MFGPPGSGKGTQAARLGKAHTLAHISTGDMLRGAMAAESDLGKRVKGVVERGDLVPDDLMLGLVRERLSEPDATGGFLLDGFPRTVPQAEGLLDVMRDLDRNLDVVVVLDVADDILVGRALKRGRSDDNEETIRHRLSVYRRQTEPVLSFLEGKVPIASVDGVGEIDEIGERIGRVLDATD